MPPLNLRWYASGFVIALVAGVGGGCSTATTYEVKVDAIAGRDAAGAPRPVISQSYVIKSKNPALGPESLRYREAEGFVKTALSGKGLYEATSEDAADIIVELEYGIEAAHTELVPYTQPVGGGSFQVRQIRQNTDGSIDLIEATGYQTPGNEDGGSGRGSRRGGGGGGGGGGSGGIWSLGTGGGGSSREVVDVEITETKLLPVRFYEKYLRVTAHENRPAAEGQGPAEVWSVRTSADDPSNDMRRYLPIMASATADFIGKDSKNQKVVRIKDPSAVVDFIRKGLNDSPPTTTTTAQAPTLPPKT